jgi:8-oxo-(d)GTP phosphatase
VSGTGSGTASDTGDGPRDVLAAGAVLWRHAPGGFELALVHRPRYDDWSFPKGKLDRGESMPAAAVREVAEETGCTARLDAVVGDVRYEVPEGRKRVRYWMAEAVAAPAFTPNDETDDLAWVAPARAAELLSYRHDLDVLRRAVALGVPSSVLVLVRHAKAGSRSQWDGPDVERPLSGTGRDQAARLAGFLPLFGPDRIATAPPVRCRETVAPAAAALGLPVTTEPLLGEDGWWADRAAGLARLKEIAAQPGATVLCSQGGVIPDVVGELTGAADVSAPKAGTWVLTWGAGGVRSADQHPSPGG